MDMPVTFQPMIDALHHPHVLCKGEEELRFVDSDLGLTSITALRQGRIKWEHTYPTEQARKIWGNKVRQGWINPVQTPKV